MGVPTTAEPEYVGDGGVQEKRVSVEVNLKSDGEEEEEEGAITDLFTSFPAIKGVEPEPNPLTVRAVLTGIVLGSLVNASNVYLGKQRVLRLIASFDYRLYAAGDRNFTM